MAKDPAFLFYSSDFLNGITDLTMEERGQFITLLCIQHQKRFLTEKTIRLSVGSVSVDVLCKFTKDENGNYTQKRLSEEIEKRKLFTESRRSNGLKGGRPKENTKPLGYPNGKPKDNHIEDENINEYLIDNTLTNNVDNNIIKENEKFEILKKEAMIVLEMMKVWMAVKPEYYASKEVDYPALLSIAYKIADDKGWRKVDVLYGREQDCLNEWKNLVTIISQNTFFKKLTIQKIDLPNNWQGVMNERGTFKKVGTPIITPEAANDFEKYKQRELEMANNKK